MNEQMFRLRFQWAMGQTETLKKMRELRKDRARMQTIFREKERDNRWLKTTTAIQQKEVRHSQEKVGIVTSAKMQKTIVVEVRRRVAHPVYKRIVTKRSKFMAHDEHGKAHEGDMVRIVESRPLSKNKRWSLERSHPRRAPTGV